MEEHPQVVSYISLCHAQWKSEYLLLLSASFWAQIFTLSREDLILPLDLISISFGWQKAHVISLDSKIPMLTEQNHQYLKHKVCIGLFRLITLAFPLWSTSWPLAEEAWEEPFSVCLV